MTNSAITLVETEAADLTTFFEFQFDEEARYLAAFTAEDPTDKEAYITKYAKFLADPTITTRTIKVNGIIAGSIAKFVIENDAEITYWLGREFWGKGIATAALQAFLKIELTRPLYGRVAFDNYGSQKTLEKCSFLKIGRERGFANAQQMEITEFIYKLSS